MKKAVACFIVVFMLVTVVPHTNLFAENEPSAVTYEVTQQLSEDGSTSTIVLQSAMQENIVVESVIKPDGSEVKEDLTSISYLVDENGTYDFTIRYLENDEEKEEKIHAEVSEIKKAEPLKEAVKNNEKVEKTDKTLKSVTLKSSNLKTEKTVTGVVEVSNFQEFNEALNNADNDVKVILLNDIELQSSVFVKKNANVTITSNDLANPHMLKRTQAAPDAYISFADATIRLDHVIVDGGAKWTENEKWYERKNVGVSSLYTLLTGDDQGRIYLNDGSIVQNCVFDRSSAEKQVFGGGAIYLSGVNSYFELNGGIVRDNAAIVNYSINDTKNRGGGALYITESQQTSQILKGEMTRNRAMGADGVGLSNGVKGGNIFLQFSNLEMSGGRIDHGHAYSGGGIALASSSTFTMTGGEISQNTVESYGGAVEIGNGTEMIMYDGMISDNEVTNSNAGGGAFRVLGTLNISGGVVRNNKAIQGRGGAILNWDGKTIISGNAEIVNNEGIYGGGIYSIGGLYNEVYVLDKAKVTYNKATKQVGNEFYIQNNRFYLDARSTRIAKDIYLHTDTYVNLVGAENNNNSFRLKTQATDSNPNRIVVSPSSYETDTGKVYKVDDAEPYIHLFTHNIKEIIKGSEFPIEDSKKHKKSLVLGDRDVASLDYEFVSNSDKEIPDAVKEYLPKDENTYVIGTEVYPKQLSQTTVKVENGIWTFKGWDSDKKTAALNFKFVGTWEFKEYEKHPVAHIFTSSVEGRELPFEVLALLPVDEKLYYQGTSVKPKQPTKTSVAVIDGIWTFTGWDADSKPADKDVAFTGIWEFKKLQYTASYAFISGTKGKQLPEEILALLPPTATYEHGDMVSPRKPEKTVMKTAEGTWQFAGWDKDALEISADTVWQGVWNFTASEIQTENNIPVIKAEDVTVETGSDFDALQYVTAYDAEDGDITKDIKILVNTVDTSKAGVYEVTYMVSDRQGASVTKTIKVTVIEKNTETKTNASSSTPHSDVQTKDATNIMVWILTLCLSASVIFTLIWRKKKA